MLIPPAPSALFMVGAVVLCDFDGTIVNIDTAEYALRKFAEGDWEKYDNQFDEGKITLKQCLEREFALVRASKSEISSEVLGAAKLRPSFRKLVYYCRHRGIPVVIVSAGLDFIVKGIVRSNGLEGKLKIRVPRTRFTFNGIRFQFPRLRFASSQSFKDDTVALYHELGRLVAYVGDGSPDFAAARAADLAFTIRDSKLSDLCEKWRIPHLDIRDFSEVIQALGSWREEDISIPGGRTPVFSPRACLKYGMLWK
jgi:HAD superfamily phosphoserine phosphatase-like hydrolase